MDVFYDQLRRRVFELWEEEGLLREKIRVRARALSTEEAIGNPEEQDFPLQKGKEKLMQAEFMHSGGQAFTDMYGDYDGTLEKILDLPMGNNYQRAVFVASLNAVLRHLGRIEGTIHCRDHEPAKCGGELLPYLEDRYAGARITQVGFQPRMVENLASRHPLRVLDMDPENIGTSKWGVRVEGTESTEDAVKWADLLLVTGTTLTNGTVTPLLHKRPVIFYGTTVAGVSYLMGWERFCPFSH